MAIEIGLARPSLPGFLGGVADLPAPAENASALDVIRGTDIAAKMPKAASYADLLNSARAQVGADIARDRDLSPAMIARLGLAWNVSEHKVYYCQERGDGLPPKAAQIVGHKALRRDDTGAMLDIVGEGYGVVQNAQAFAPFDDAVASGRAEYVGGGTFNGGRQVYLQAKLAYSDEVVPGDRVVPMLLLKTGHGQDGGALRASLLLTRLVCLNGATVTERVAIFSVRHTRNAVGRVRSHEITLANVFKNVEERMELFKAMARTKLSQAEFRAFLEMIFAMPESPEEKPRAVANVERLRREVAELAEGGRGTDIRGVRGTLWGAYNAVTEHVDHVRARRGDAESRLHAIWYGAGAETKNRAFDAAMQMMRVAR